MMETSPPCLARYGASHVYLDSCRMLHFYFPPARQQAVVYRQVYNTSETMLLGWLDTLIDQEH